MLRTHPSRDDIEAWKLHATPAVYVRALLWFALFVAAGLSVMNIVQLFFVDFIHGNSHRSQNNAITMMMTFTPLMGFIGFTAALIIFALPQWFQAVMSGVIVRRFGSRAQAGVLLFLPVTALITWYCYDFLTPSNMGLAINDGPEGSYQHGLTLARYTAALAWQVPATLFSTAYVAAGAAREPRRTVIRWAIAAAVVAGGVAGYHSAQMQYQFLDPSSN